MKDEVDELAKYKAEVYRFYDADDRLLYVGVSRNAVTRYAEQHRLCTSWAGRVVKMTIERFDQRVDALAAEANAIAEEKPVYNKSGGVCRDFKC